MNRIHAKGAYIRLRRWREAAAQRCRLRVAGERVMLGCVAGLVATAWAAWRQFVRDGVGAEEEAPGAREARCVAVKEWLMGQASAALLKQALARVC